MLRGIDRASWSRALMAGAVFMLVACSPRREGTAGHVEVLVSGVCDGARDGELRLEGITTTVVAGVELCQGTVLRELPVGLYSLSWRSGAHDGVASATPAAWQGPTLLGVLAGHTTRLRVTLESLPSPAISDASKGDDRGPLEGTCQYTADRAGPS